MASPRKTKTGYATWAETRKLAATWSEPVLQCRTMGHAWKQNIDHPENGTKEGSNFIVHFLCTRGCEVSKVERWNARGLKVKVNMHYPSTTDGKPAYLSDIGYIDAEAKGAIRLATLGR